MSVIDRILDIIEYKGINKRKFYIETGLSNGFLDKVKDIGVSKLELISNTYPEINIEWLITGKGNKIKDQNIDLHNMSIDEILKLDLNKDINKLVFFLINNNNYLLEQPVYKEFIKDNIETLELIEQKIETQNKIDKVHKLMKDKIFNKHKKIED